MSKAENSNISKNTELLIYKIQNSNQTAVEHDSIQSVICKIVEKSYEANKRCLLLCNSEEEVELFDNKLWTYSKLSFIPHGSKYSISNNDAMYCQTWISEELVYINNPNYLINLGQVLGFEDNKYFEKIMEITYNTNDNIDTIKNKYGITFDKCTLWIQNNGKWIKSN